MQISLLNLVPEMQLANIYQRKRDMIRTVGPWEVLKNLRWLGGTALIVEMGFYADIF